MVLPAGKYKGSVKIENGVSVKIENGVTCYEYMMFRLNTISLLI